MNEPKEKYEDETTVKIDRFISVMNKVAYCLIIVAIIVVGVKAL